MIFGRELSWYISFVRNPLIIVTLLLIFIELATRLPQFIGLTLIVSTPISWFVKAVGAFFVGYRIGEAEKKVLPSMAAGVIFGVGLGIVSVGISLFRRITFVQPEFFGIFGGFDIFFTAGSEMITAAFFAGVGSVLAGGKLENL